ncbi:MAG: hypothetical protein ACLR0N_09980 [Bilophila wadsworthia]
MEKTAQATLSAPITVQGKKTDILTLRRATLGDDEDAMDMAISFNRGNNPVTVELCTLSIVTGFPTTCSGRSTRTTSGRSARRTIPSALKPKRRRRPKPRRLRRRGRLTASA